MSFEIPRVQKPEDVGLSSTRLARIRDTLQADIDKDLVPGAVTLIARRGRIATLDVLGLSRPRGRRCNGCRHDLPDRFDDKAVHFSCRNDAG